MKPFLRTAFAAVLAAGLSTAALAQSSFTARDSAGVTRTFASFACNGIICSMAVPADATGAAFGVNANPFYINFASGVSLPGFASTPPFKLQDGSGNAIGSSAGALNVNCTAGCTGGGGGGGNVNITQILGAAPSATNPLWVQPGTGASWAVTGTFWPYSLGQQVSGSSVPVVLPAAQITALTPPTAVTANAGTNLNTSALALETGGHLAAIDGKVPALGQALAAGSVPVVLTASQLSTLTPPAAITGFALDTSVGTTNTDLGPPGATACATDNGSCSLNALLQRNNQRITSLITALGTPFQAGGSIGNTSFAATQATAANLNATVVGTGTFAVQAAQSGTWNVTNISGTVSLPTGAATSALQPTNAAIASTTSGQTGHMMMGAVTTAAPSYTTAQTNPLSLTTAGALRVDGSASTQPVSGTVTANVGTGTRAVSIASAQVASGAYASGSLASGAVVDLTNLSTPIAPNTATATKGMLIGGQYNSTQATFTNAQQGSLQITSRGELMVSPGVSGFPVTIAGSQSVNVAQVLGSAISATNGLFSNLLQGNAALSATNPIFSSVTDGTNKAAVKAASTAPVATDPALVVTLSPNSVSNTKVATTRPSFSNATQNPITTGDDGGIVVTDAKSLGPTTVSSATTVFTFATWPYEYVHIDVSGNNGSQWVLECSDQSGTQWFAQPLVTDDRTFVGTTSFAGTLFSSMNSRLADNQCRVRVSVYGSPDSLTFTAQLRKTGSEPVSAVNVQNQVAVQNTKGSSDPNAGFNSATSTYYSSAALESGHVIKGSQAAMTQVCASATAAVTLQVFNSTTVPANATPVSPAPVAFKQIASGAKGCIPESPGGMANLGLSSGLSVACSTDASPVNKATATSSCLFEVRYQ